jgi:hypothetical protein
MIDNRLAIALPAFCCLRNFAWNFKSSMVTGIASLYGLYFACVLLITLGVILGIVGGLKGTEEIEFFIYDRLLVNSSPG